MSTWLGVVCLLLAAASGALAVLGHRRSPDTPATAWGARASLLISLAIIVGTVPTLFFPAAHWLSWTGSLLSLAFMATSFALLQRQQRALRSFNRASASDRLSDN
jgi:phosphatidylglycerophosphate synthase